MGCTQSTAADLSADSVESRSRDRSASENTKGVPPLTKAARATSITSEDSDIQSPSRSCDDTTTAEQPSHGRGCDAAMLGRPDSDVQGRAHECCRPSSSSLVTNAALEELHTSTISIASCLYCMEQCDDSFTCTDVVLADALFGGDSSVLRFWAAVTTALHALIVTPPGPLDATATELFSEVHHPIGRSLAARIFDLPSSDISAKMNRQQVFVEIFTIVAALSAGLKLSVACITHAVFLVHRAVFAGVRLTALTLRPMLLTAIILASKEFHDESLRIADVQRLLPMLDLRPVAQMERRLLRLLDYRVSIATQLNKQTQFFGHLRSLHLHPDQAVANFTESTSCLAIQRWVFTLCDELR